MGRALPFQGQGHLDAELDAWVGLHRNGYICACRVISPSFQSTAPCFYPDCKMTREDMLAKKSMTATLTYMGASRFCLVECAAAKKAEKRRRPTFGSRDGCLIHLTMFGLKYSHKGELQISDHHWSTRSFLVSRHRDHFVPHAFWM